MSGIYRWNLNPFIALFLSFFFTKIRTEVDKSLRKLGDIKADTHSQRLERRLQKRTRLGRRVLRHKLAQGCAFSCIMTCFSCAAMVSRYSKRARTFFTKYVPSRSFGGHVLEIPPCQISMCGVAYSCSYVLLPSCNIAWSWGGTKYATTGGMCRFSSVWPSSPLNFYLRLLLSNGAVANYVNRTNCSQNSTDSMVTKSCRAWHLALGGKRWTFIMIAFSGFCSFTMQADILLEPRRSRPAACLDVPAALTAKRKDSHSVACRRTDVDMFCKDRQVVQD